jgi:hypothetical protein
MPKQYVFIFGGAIGDSLLGVQLAHILEVAFPSSRLIMISTRESNFVGELLELVPQVEYRELLRSDIRSWFALLRLACSPHNVVFLEPFQDAIPLWWKIIARMMTLSPGSVEIRCQSRPQKVPARIRVISYSPVTDNLFSMIARVVPPWGGSPLPAPVPSFPVPTCPSSPARPYILFHFFAGAYRRSFPIEKVRSLLVTAREKFPRYEFLLTCAHQEEMVARKMIEGISDTRVEVNPHARELVCLLEQSSICVGVASGVIHIASHLGVPSVALCNLSDPCWLPTYAKNTLRLSARENCRCKGNKTGDCGITTPGGIVYRCLYDITTENIIAAIELQLTSRQPKTS